MLSKCAPKQKDKLTQAGASANIVVVKSCRIKWTRHA